MLPSGNNYYKKKYDILSCCHLEITTIKKEENTVYTLTPNKGTRRRQKITSLNTNEK